MTARYFEAIEDVFARELEPVPGVIEALDRITLPCCVASSGPHHKMAVTLRTTGLWDRFEGRIFSATEVEHGKPAPDLFLHAAARMGFDPAHTAVVEDSLPGIQAAVAAGHARAGVRPPHRTGAARGRRRRDLRRHDRAPGHPGGMSAPIARNVVISGDVQGVFFRDCARREARRLGVSGWVRNRADGCVEAHLEGPPDAVAEVVLWCRSGPRHATVEDLQVTHAEPEGFDGFAIR